MIVPQIGDTVRLNQDYPHKTGILRTGLRGVIRYVSPREDFRPNGKILISVDFEGVLEPVGVYSFRLQKLVGGKDVKD